MGPAGPGVEARAPGAQVILPARPGCAAGCLPSHRRALGSAASALSLRSGSGRLIGFRSARSLRTAPAPPLSSHGGSGSGPRQNSPAPPRGYGLPLVRAN